MEALLETQFQLMEVMRKFLDNFKKDGADRKTPDRIPRRLQMLDQYWADFQENHEKLCEEEGIDHPYFSDNQYGVTKQFYLTTRQYVSSFMTSERKPMTLLSNPPISKTEPSPQPGPRGQVQDRVEQPDAVEPASFPSGSGRREDAAPINPETSEAISRGSFSKTDEMLRKQTSNFRAFVRTVSNISLDHINEKWEFEDALKTLQARWTAIDTLHWEIDSILETRNVTYEMNYNTYEMQYNKIKKEINTKMWSVSHREKSTPKMEIPIFSGSYQHWTSFKDLFTEAIHANPSLPNAQKMQFLKSKVKGEAEKLIQHLLISSDNYQTCWDILNHRYNNKKMIFTSHLNILLSLPNTQQQSAASIKKIHDTTNECLHAIKNLGVDTTSWDPILVHLLSQKLDAETHNDYVESLKMPRELPTLDDFLEFLENKFTSLESSRRKPDVSRPYQHYQHQYEPSGSNKKFHSYKAFSTNQNLISKSYSNNQFNRTSNNYNEQYKCPHCKNDHKLFACKPFLGLQPEGKREMIAKYNLCKNCLYDHKGKECHSQKRCRVCNGNHNTLLHDSYGNPTPGTSFNKGIAAENKQPNNNNSNHVSQEDLSEILLATALIKVRAMDKSQVTLRALIDAGSQTSLVSERAAQILRLPRERCKGVIFGVGAKENNCKGIINITCTALNNNYTFNTDVYVMRNLINNLPNKSFKKPSWDFLENIDLADPEFYISRPVDILLGADIYSNIIQEGIIRHDKRQPLAQQTRIGWILVGNVQPLQCNVVLNNVEDIHKFWTMEDISETSNISQEDLDCLHHYQKTTKRNEEGRYIVSMPLKPGFEDKLGASKPMAVAQFRQLENKFIRQPKLAEAYKSFMHEYQSLNHMVECTSDETPSCFFPHHGIERPESATSALRVVFNASAKTSTGYTLNDLMSRGPNLQQDLMSLILRWRQYQYVYVADICKMFRQIAICPEQQQYQKIIWRASPNEPLREYKLTTVTYGTRAAPFLAMMTLKQLAIDEGHKYPASPAAQALQEEFYMDDLVSGSFTLETAKQLQSDLIQLLQSGGFNLRKWASNKAELLEGVSKAEDIQPEFTFKHIESTTKTLGLKWNPNEDQFTFQMKNDITATPSKHTKRSLLSEISKIFDPLGWYSPLTTKFKLLFKQTWLSNIQWDDELPSDIKVEWDKLRSELQYINDFKIPRWYQTGECDNIELHGFSDSSAKAYACVVYCKVKNIITLVAAKSRLVPETKTKNLTLPRLELSGALLLSKLMSKIQQALAGHHIKVFGWTDSTAVLGWLQGDSGRWKPFAANRVKQKIEVIPPNNWRYVKSSENPADSVSRGISGEQLKQHTLWWNGPAFLSSFNEEHDSDRPVYVTDQEVRSIKHSNVTTRHTSDDVIEYILSKFSNMVIIHEPNLPSGKWALGRVTELHPGADGLVRVVTLKTKSGFIKRPVVKLSLLTTDNSLNTAYNSVTTSDQANTVEHNNNQHTPQTTAKNAAENEKGSKKINFASMALSLLLFMIVISPGQCYYNITKLSKSLYLDRVSSMHVIRDEWRLVVYYDMNPYWDGSDTFEKYLKQIDHICAKTENKPLCDIILLQLHHGHSELQYYNSMLLSQRFESHVRERRGLVDGVGYVANSLFGVLDQRFADQYVKDITHIKQNQKHLALLWKNQTSVAEAEYNLLKRTEVAINQQHKVINQHLNSLINATNTLNKEVQHAEVMNELALSTIIANNMLAKLKSIQDTLLDTITDIHHGMFNIHLLSPEQLRNELNITSGQLSQDLSLPINNIQTGMAKIYHLLKVKARVTQQYLIFEIKIPLVNRESFDLYKIITIPQQIKNKTISVVPISDHVAINLRKDTYLTMTERDVQQCLQYEESTRLCHSRKPIFHFKSDESLCIRDQITNKCQTIISSCRNSWMELNKINTYLYYCCEECTLRIICEDQVTAAQTEKAGVIVLGQSCVIKGEDFTVISHKDQLSEIKSYSDIYTPEISQINHIINISLPLSDINITDHRVELDQIKSQIQQMKSETALKDDISYHDVHQFSIIYILLIAAVIAAGAITWRRLRSRRSGSADLRSEPEEQQPASVVTHAPQTQPRALGRTSRQELPQELKVLSSIRKTTHNKATSPVLHKTVFNDSGRL